MTGVEEGPPRRPEVPQDRQGLDGAGTRILLWVRTLQEFIEDVEVFGPIVLPQGKAVKSSGAFPDLIPL